MKLKSRSRDTQEKFLKKLQELLKAPEILVPECLEKGFMCHFEAYSYKLAKYGPGGGLARFSRSGDQLLRGMAETQRIVDSGSAPLLGVISTPFGNVDYGKKGDADPVVLAGIHNYDHPIYRALAFSSLVKTKGATVYTSSNYYRASCRGTPPDQEFLKDALSDERIAFTEIDGNINVGNSPETFQIVFRNVLKIVVHGDSDQNTYFRIMKHILSRDHEKELAVRCSEFSEYSSDIPKDALAKYYSNKSTDKAFLSEVISWRIGQASGKGVCFIGNKPYNSPAEFVKDVQTEGVDPAIMEKYVELYGKGIRLESASFRKLLEIIWPEYGNDILRDVFPGITDSDVDRMKGNPLEMITNHRRELRRRQLSESFAGKDWSPDSRFLFDLLTTLINDGYDAFARQAEKNTGTSRIRKAIVYAVDSILGKMGDKTWKYGQAEIDIGENVIPCMRDVVQGNLSNVDRMIECIRVYVT